MRAQTISQFNQTSTEMVETFLKRGYTVKVEYVPRAGAYEFVCYTFQKSDPVLHVVGFTNRIEKGLPSPKWDVYMSIPVLDRFSHLYEGFRRAEWGGDTEALKEIVDNVTADVERLATTPVSPLEIYDTFEDSIIQAATAVQRTDTGVVFVPVFKHANTGKYLYVHATYLEDTSGVRYPVRTIVDLAKALSTLLQYGGENETSN